MNILKTWTKALLAILLVGPAGAGAVDIRFQPVADGVYAHIGDIGPRTAANEGLNANIGLVLTRTGAILIDSGATQETARQIEEAVRVVTAKPVRWVVNTGGQDHRWLGNGYFAGRGAELIAHAAAVPDMRSRGGDQLAALRALLGAKADGTVPALPTRLIGTADARVELDGVEVQFRHRGGGHTPGDLMVWLPQSRVLFAGDIVYVDRMLAVLPVSSTRSWLEAFAVVEQLAPARIVPGHGRVTDLALARQHTLAYLRNLRAHMKKAVDANTEISEAIRSFDVSPFDRLVNAAELHPGNASRVYLEIERE
ncbi:MBL fold metallo-hydrolase [Caenimonas sedimenti]|uniref:MBL fold metallo-hydrolase n=1 Tax=Caenimonas sedimenti TaxID=2596921 RepID=A0A562ZJF3_9BURK|nr:MBL fold metallo-hydrolase [Caenimonas sedimenti]TWO68710.1 MBL fold metallo-hydrolase [Caenimonas sedimenti]